MGRDFPGPQKGELKVCGAGIEMGRGQRQFCPQLRLQWATPITVVMRHDLVGSGSLTPGLSSVCVTFNSYFRALGLS